MAEAGALHTERLHGALSALNGIPFSCLNCGVLCSRLCAGPPSPAPASPAAPRLEGAMGGEGEHGGKCVGPWGDLAQSWAEHLSPLLAGTPTP